MTDKEKHKQELLDKYLNQNISKEERHELEKLALDDPFLFEALQGFAQAKGDHIQDISDLKKKIGAKGQKKKRRSIIPYSIAASLLIVVGLSFWLADKGTVENEMASVSSKERNLDAMVAEAEETNLSSVESASVADSIFKKKVDEAGDIVAQVELNRSQSLLNDESGDQSGKASIEEIKAKNTLQKPKLAPTKASPVPIESQGYSDEYEIEESVIEASDVVISESTPVANKSTQVLEKIETVTSAQEDAAPREEKLKRSKTKNENVFEADGFVGGSASGTGLTAFDVHFINLVKKNLSRKEQRKLNDNVELQFAIIEGVISEFKVVPSQGEKIDALLLDYVRSGAKLLPEQNALLMVYDIGF